MKKILLILGLTLFTIFAYSQKPKAEVVRYTEVTTAEKNAFVVPAGEHWNVYDITLQRFEFWDGDSWEPRDTGGGETNTASSQGSGTTIFYQKSGVDLQFNAIKSENNLLTISLDGTTHDVELTVNQGNISITASQVSDFDTEVSNNSSVTANTAKDTNVPTALSTGTVTATTYGITSDGGADDLVLPEANTTQAGLLGADKWDEIVANTIKTSNATHTGEITGATTLTADPTIISNKTLKSTLDGTEELLINDSGLKKTTLQAIADLSGVGVNGILQKNLSWGESYITNWRDIVLDDGATYFPNNGGYEKGRLHQLGINPSLHFVFGAVKAGTIYSLGTNRTNDLDEDRLSEGTYVDEDGIIQTALDDVARIDYTDGDGALVIEPQSTNLALYSEEFDNAVYSGNDGSRVNIVANSVISPDGTQNADTYAEADFTVSHRAIQTIGSYLAGDTFINTYFFKKGTRNWVQIVPVTSGTVGVFVNFDLENGVIGSSLLTSINVDIDNSSITDYGNGWYKCSITFTLNLNKQVGITCYLMNTNDFNSSGENYAGSSSNYVYIWGAQLKQQSVATSYIKTEGTTVTRLADVINGAGDVNTFNSTEGVLFVEMAALEDALVSRRISLSDNTNNNYLSIIYWSTSNLLVIENIVGGVNSVFMQHSLTDETEFIEIAIKYKENDYSLYVDGVNVLNDTNSSIWPINTFNTLNLAGGSGISNSLEAKVRQIKYYKSIADAQKDLPYITNFFPLLLIGFRRRNQYKNAA